jgi:putative hemolysin
MATLLRHRSRASALPRATTAIVNEVPRAALKAEIDTLPSNQRLVDGGVFQVYWARANQAPRILDEIGRLRELTFRAAGEGTGKSVDIDAFDAYYLHLFVWDSRACAIAAAYRLGLVDEISEIHGERGLYTHSLFRYRAGMLETLNPAIELGRSFVRAEYQRHFAPMMLLWCGIGHFIERTPRYAVLFGAVSISSSYSSASRQLIVDFLSAYGADSHLRNQVRPRRPFRGTGTPTAEGGTPATVNELSRMIARIEPDQKGVPVLLRQYLRLGGRILSFNVDRQFGSVLDGLIMVDLRQVEPKVLARYMGKPGMVAFRAYHSLEDKK